ncbi:MAG: HAMP domain-containing histidine kinase [Aphanocapsa lilacina HA4352-LM1]|jgi:signal transduction histidine kinase|nr:HAMP domain-containing histidine kinase [Aphanocapsa lilacina HA4352-LM1]
MSKITFAIEKNFYAAIQWSLKHQLKAMAIILLGVIVPIGTLNVLQYQSMVQYEQQGTRALQEQMQSLLGRMALRIYTDIYRGSSEVFHSVDREHNELFSGKPGIAGTIVGALQNTSNGYMAKKKEAQLALFIFAKEPDGSWQTYFGRSDSDNPARRSAVARAREYFFTLPPERQDTGHQYYYDAKSEMLVLLHTMSPAPLVNSDTPPLRPIKAVMGLTLTKKDFKDNFKYQTQTGVTSRFDTTPLDSQLAGTTYYYQVKDEKGQVLYKDPGWDKNVGCSDFIRADFRITPEQRFLTGWELSAITRSNFKQATERSLTQMFWASGIVAVLLGILLVVLFRAGLVAVKVSELQTDIVAGVSHDLKTPLAGIIASAQLIASGRASGAQETKQFSGYILAEARRLTAVVEKVLTMAKLESRQLLMKPAPLSVPELIDHAIGLSQVAHPQAIIARGEVATGQVTGDANALTTVLMNLIDNAVRYSGDAQPWVRVQSYWSGFGEKRILHLLVEDRGVGIPAEEQAFIFQKFYRVRNGLVSDTEGTGLGLAIASQIVNAHRGQILVESRVGIGSTFTVKIPHEQPHFGR